MMERASTVIQDILEEVQIAAAEQPIESVDQNKVIRAMNRYMTSLDARGVAIGYTKINNPTDFVTVPDGALEGIVFNVSVRILNAYDIPLTSELSYSAKEGEQTIYHLGVNVDSTAYPDTLPIGSGNDDDNDLGYGKFYPGEDESTIGSEDGRNIGLESNT